LATTTQLRLSLNTIFHFFEALIAKTLASFFVELVPLFEPGKSLAKQTPFVEQIAAAVDFYFFVFRHLSYLLSPAGK